jgi:hypothetical protein
MIDSERQNQPPAADETALWADIDRVGEARTDRLTLPEN